MHLLTLPSIGGGYGLLCTSHIHLRILWPELRQWQWLGPRLRFLLDCRHSQLGGLHVPCFHVYDLVKHPGVHLKERDQASSFSAECCKEGERILWMISEGHAVLCALYLQDTKYSFR
jgi:hypothetical protein